MKQVPHLLLRGPREHEEALYPILLGANYTGLIEEEGHDGPLWRIFFPPETSLAAMQSCLDACLATHPRRLTGEIAALTLEDWSVNWREHFQPLAIAPGIVIVAPGDPYVARPGEQVIQINPGMAFGTGQHATTQLIAEALVADAPTGQWQRLLDLGTGSGILALIAATCGVPHIDAVDIDRDAVEAAHENIERNGRGGQIHCYDTMTPVTGPYNAIVANILLEPLCELAPLLHARLRPGGDCYLSGVLADQIALLTEHMEAAGFTTVRTTYREDWAMLHVRA